MFNLSKMKNEEIMLIVLVLAGMFYLFCNRKEMFQQMPTPEVYHYVREGENKRQPRDKTLYQDPSNPEKMNLKPGACGGNYLSSDLLPKDDVIVNDAGFEFAPKDVQKAVEDNVGFLRREINIDTVGKTVRSLDLRNTPKIEKKWEGPWNYSTLDPDLYRKNLDAVDAPINFVQNNEMPLMK